jgi:homoserine dehydrogenase
VARLLISQREELSSRIGSDIELAGIAVRDRGAKRDVELDSALYTTDAESLIVGADIVVELIGGLEPAGSLIKLALNSGADVVTANKALIAAHGPELFNLAEQLGAQLYYEAAVGGAIPIIRPLRESLAGDSVNRVMGIVNGTTNFILDRMESTGANFADALQEAKDLGYAEADPTADIEAYDAASKAAILASLAFHTEVPVASVHREGITSVTAAQIETARAAGYAVKLLAICERIADSGIAVRVHPTLVPLAHPLAAVRGAFNAVFVEAESAGQLMFYGAGAGGPQTASAVLGDVVSAAKRHLVGGPGIADSSHASLAVLPISVVDTRYQITLAVNDLPGVLANIAGIFAQFGVSVETVQQSAAGEGENPLATLTIMTHRAKEAELAEVVANLEKADAVSAVTAVIRVEGI